nr:ABC1-like protein (ABC1) [Polytomella parva]
MYGYTQQDDLKKVLLMATRLGRELTVVSQIIYDYKSTLKSLTKENEEEEMKKCHQRSADKLIDLCFKNGGVFIKLGQHMGQLDHLLPEEYVLTMRSNLLDKCPVTPFEKIEATFFKDFGKRPLDVFTTFSPTPIASASLAQVHIATDATGRKYAVKVQHPGLKESAEADIALVEVLVKGVSRLFPDFDYDWLVQQIKDTVPKELDFQHEAENAEICRRNLKSKKSTVGSSVHVPEVYHDLSSEHILTMEFVDGVGVTDRAALTALGAEPAAVARLVSRTFSEMIFAHGYVHCDPHAANMFVRRDPDPKKPNAVQLVLLDHGLYKRIDDSFRYDYAALWHALIFSDEENIKKFSGRMNAGDLFPIFSAMLTQKSWEQIMEKSEDHLNMDFSKEQSLAIQHYSKMYAREITMLLQRMPEALVLLLKTNDCLRCVDHALGQPINTISITARQCARALAEQRLAVLGVVEAEDKKDVDAESTSPAGLPHVPRPSSFSPSVLYARAQSRMDLIRIEIQLMLLRTFMMQKQLAVTAKNWRAKAAKWGWAKPPAPQMPEMMLTVITSEEESAIAGTDKK